MRSNSDRTYVIIPQFLVNKELVDLARDAIESYRKSSDVFIISVDDSGEFGNAKGAEEVLNLSDKVIKNKKNMGFGPTCNKGFKWVFDNEKKDCYIICSNNDIRVHSRVIPELIKPFNMFEDVAITGIYSTKEKDWEGEPLEDMCTPKMAEGGLLGDRMQDGGLWMSKKSVLQKIGIFDERFLRGGYEDVDLFLRARDTFGMKIIMSSFACYWHKQGATRWNSEQVGAINNFGVDSKRIEDQNLGKFIDKWGYNPHASQIWNNNEIFNA